MWVQLDEEHVERLMRIARAAGQRDVAEKLQHRLDVDAKDARSLTRYRGAAEAIYGNEGEFEFDDDAVVSGGTADGAYVMGWRWVDAGDLQRAPARRHVKSRY